MEVVLWVEIALNRRDSYVSNYPRGLGFALLDGFEDFEFVEIDAEDFPFERVEDHVIIGESPADLYFGLRIENRVSKKN